MAHANNDHNHDHEDSEHRRIRGVRRLADRFRGAMPHSHDHADSIDATLASSGVGIRCVKGSLVVLGITAAFQLVIVGLSGSVALLADTIHNLSDAFTAIPLWIAFVLSRRASTKRYPYGFGRAEDLAGLFVLATIAISAALVAWQSIQRLRDPVEIEAIGWVAVAAVVGFVGNEAVAVYRIRVGRRISSAALIADGQHARTDGLTSLAVLVGVIGAWAGFPILDPIVGLAISLVIVFILRDAGRRVFHRVLDGVDEETIDEIERVTRAVQGVRDVTEVRARWAGHRVIADVDVMVDRDLHTHEAHDIADAVESSLTSSVSAIDRVTVHVHPTHGEVPSSTLPRHAHRSTARSGPSSQT